MTLVGNCAFLEEVIYNMMDFICRKNIKMNTEAIVFVYGLNIRSVTTKRYSYYIQTQLL